MDRLPYRRIDLLTLWQIQMYVWQIVTRQRRAELYG